MEEFSKLCTKSDIEQAPKEFPVAVNMSDFGGAFGLMPIAHKMACRTAELNTSVY